MGDGPSTSLHPHMLWGSEKSTDIYSAKLQFKPLPVWVVWVCAKSLGSQQGLFPFKQTLSMHSVNIHGAKSHHVGLNYNVIAEEI